MRARKRTAKNSPWERISGERASSALPIGMFLFVRHGSGVDADLDDALLFKRRFTNVGGSIRCKAD